MPRLFGRRPTALLLALLVAATGLVASSGPPNTVVAAPGSNNFTPARFQVNDNGAIALFGNTLLTCPPSATCSAALAGTASGANQNNNEHVMTNLDVDTDVSTFNSSSSTVTLPPGSTVLFAGLYWGARTTAGSGGQATTAPRGWIAFRTPNSPTYTTLTSQQEFGPNGSDNAYQQFRNVTTLVQAAGNGEYWGANVAAGTGKDRYAGWSLAIVYRNPALPLRNLTVFDGFNSVSSGSPQTITISGFTTPVSGSVTTQVGFVAYEGDLGSTGDYAKLNGRQLASDLSVGSNFFNSTNDRNGTSVADRRPANRNLLGFDIKDITASGFLANSATSASIELNTGGETYYPGVVTTTIDLYAPDFTPSRKTVVDVSGNTPTVPGDTLEYTLSYVNAGQDPATNAISEDVLPPNTTFVQGSLEVVSGANTGPKTDGAGDDQAEYVAAARTVRFRVGTGATASAGGTLGTASPTDPDPATTVRFRVTVEPGAANTTLVNRATLDYRAATLNLPFTYRGNQVETPVVASADVSVTKSTAPDPVAAGGEVTSTLTVANSGPNAAQGVVVTDELPAGVVFVSASPGCTPSPQLVTCSIGPIANGASTNVSVTVRVPPDSDVTSLTDVATVSSSTSDPDLSDNTSGATVGVIRQADLVVDKTGPTTPVVPGTQFDYTISVRNDGPSNAVNVTLTDLLPDGLTAVSTSRPDICPTLTRCVLAGLAVGVTETVVLTVVLDAAFTGTSLTNTASAVSETPDPNPGRATDTVVVPVGPPQANMQATKTADPTTVVAGRTVRYTIVVTNAGPSLATNAQLTDTPPPGLTATAAVSNRGTCTIVGGVVCSLGDLSVGANATITVTAAVSPDAALGTVTNEAVATSDVFDPVPGEAIARAPVTIVGEADVGLTKLGVGDPTVGQIVSFTLTATNAGPSRSARGVTITDTLPPQLAIVDAGPCTAAGQVLTCPAIELAAGAAASFTFAAQVVAAGTIVNTATVATTGSTDPNADNDSATFTLLGGTRADVSISKDGPATITAGAGVTYTVTVSNAGPSPAAAVTVADALPAGLTFVSAAASQGTCGPAPPVSCTLGTIASGASRTITIQATAAADLPAGDRLTNTATVDSPTPDPTDANNTANASSDVVTQANVHVDKILLGTIPASTTIEPGEPFVFRVLVTNDGPSVARSVTLIDNDIDIELALFAVAIDGVQYDPTAPDFPCEISSGDLLCPLGDLSSGQQVEILLGLFASPDQAPGDFGNEAKVSTPTPETTTADNVSVAPFTIANPVAELRLQKLGPTELQAGGTFQYEVRVYNDGPSAAAAVTVTDVLPARLVPRQAQTTQGNCAVAGQTVTCNLGAIDQTTLLFGPDAFVTVLVTGDVLPTAAAGPVTNTASVTSTTTDPTPGPTTGSTTATIVRQADLTLTKVADADTVAAGAVSGYTLTVTNAGPASATDVVLNDILPAGVEYVDDPTDPCAPGPPVTCNLRTVPPGETVVVRVEGRIDPAFTGTQIVNTATVTSTTDDPTPPGEATTTTPVTRSADVAVTKVPDAAAVVAGQQVTYAITVSNNGPSDAVDLVVTDTLPPGTTIAPQTVVPGGGCTVVGQVATCTRAVLLAGETVSVFLVLDIDPASPPGPLTNFLSAVSATHDPDITNNTAAPVVDVGLVADTEVTKAVVTDPVVPGAPIQYRLTVVNRGPSVALTPEISDTLAPGLTFIGPTGTCQPIVDLDLVIVSCRLPNLAVGASTEVLLELATAPDLTGTLTNTALVGSQGLDPDSPDNQSTVTVPLVPQADVSVTKSGPRTVSAASPAEYVINYRNDGPSTATNVVVTDTLRAGLVPRPVDGCTIAANTVTCPVGTLAPGASGRITVTADVDPRLANGTALTDAAAITSNAADPDKTDNSAEVASTIDVINDIAVTVTADEAEVTAGSPVSYAVVVTNNGPQLANDVTLTNQLPAELGTTTTASFGRARSMPMQVPTGCLPTGGTTATCDLGDLAVSASVTVVFGGTVAAGTPAGTRLVDTATVAFDGTDAVEANNTDADTILVVAQVPTPTTTTTTTTTPGAVTTTVKPGGGGGSGSLPATGAAIAVLLAVAAILLVAGGGLRNLAGRPRPPRRPRSGP